MKVEDFIEKHEGRRHKPYKCSAGYWTIGVGYNFDANPFPDDISKYLKKYGEITDEMIDRLLWISIGAAKMNCYKLFPDFGSFSVNRQMALIDFVFNVGYAGAKRFVHAVAAINTGRWQDAGREMMDSAWFRQVTSRALEVIELIVEG